MEPVGLDNLAAFVAVVADEHNFPDRCHKIVVAELAGSSDSLHLRVWKIFLFNDDFFHLQTMNTHCLDKAKWDCNRAALVAAHKSDTEHAETHRTEWAYLAFATDTELDRPVVLVPTMLAPVPEDSFRALASTVWPVAFGWIHALNLSLVPLSPFCEQNKNQKFYFAMGSGAVKMD